jgi:hypothetical protein
MTLPRKNSRKVTIKRSEIPNEARNLGHGDDALKYRWVASAPHYSATHGPFVISFHAHLDKEPADSILEVLFYDAHCNSVTPLIAKAIVVNAIVDGWDPGKKGVFRVSPNTAAKRGYFELPGA